ncbi:MAG: hypothetical protein ACTSUS_02585 [Candidatus Freyarchaeota archaeon]
MAGAAYDHLIAITVMGIFFIAAVAAIPNIGYVNLLHVDQQRLRNVALEVLKTILFETGHPPDWGSQDPFDPSEVQSFGLASSNSSVLYTLDPDKVQRLVEENPLGYMDYETLRELLGLRDFGIGIRITPPFNIEHNENITIINSGRDHQIHVECEIKVSRRDGYPIPNAIVNAIVVYLTDKKDSTYPVNSFYTQNVLTNALGICNINETQTSSEKILEASILIIYKVTVAEVSTILTYAYYSSGVNPDDIAKINIVGDEIVLWYHDPEGSPPPQGARWVDHILICGQDTFTVLYNGSRTNEDKLTYGEGYRVWSHTFNGLKHKNPVLIIFSFSVPTSSEGRTGVLVVGPYPTPMGYRIIWYGGTPQGATATLCRCVSISGMTYVLELVLWREAPW